MIADAQIRYELINRRSILVFCHYSQIIITICDLGCIPFHLKRGLGTAICSRQDISDEKPGWIRGSGVAKGDLTSNEAIPTNPTVEKFHSLQSLSFTGTLDEDAGRDGPLSRRRAESRLHAGQQECYKQQGQAGNSFHASEYSIRAKVVRGKLERVQLEVMIMICDQFSMNWNLALLCHCEEPERREGEVAIWKLSIEK